MAEFRPGLRDIGCLPSLLPPTPPYSPFGGKAEVIMIVVKAIALWEPL